MRRGRIFNGLKRQGKNALVLILALGLLFPSGVMANATAEGTWKESGIEPEQPDTTEPEQPDTTEPEQPDTTEPEQPDTTEPEMPGVIQPDEEILEELLKENLGINEFANPKMVLYSDVEGENPITEGQEIALTDSLYIGIKWESLEGAGELTEKEIHVGTLPNAIAVPTEGGTLSVEADLPLEVTPASNIFATLRWAAGQRDLWVTFHDMGEYKGEPILNLLEDAEIIYQCALKDDSSNANNKGEIVIDLPYENCITIKVKEWLPKGPELSKSVGDIDANGIAIWTILYTRPTATYEGAVPDALVDTLPEGLTFVSGSFKESSQEVTVDHSAEGSLTFDVSRVSPGTTVTITYQTKLSESALEKIWHGGQDTFAYKNEVEAFQNMSSLNPKLAASAKLEVNNSNWPAFHMMEKDGMVHRPVNTGDPWTIDWEITVHAAKQNFQSLQVIDTMGKGLILDQDSVEVNGEAVTPDLSTVDGKTEMTIRLVTDGQADESYHIKYTTEIDGNYFNQNGTDALTDEDLNNVAKIVYTWKSSGKGPAPENEPPVITKTPQSLGINGSLIKKETVGAYDAVNHSFRWEVTLNPNKVDITNIEMKDDLTVGGSEGMEQTFLGEGKDKAETETLIRAAVEQGLTEAGVHTSVLQSVALSDDGKVLSVEMGSIGKNQVTISLTTYVADSEIWAGNVVNREFRNTAQLLQSGTQVEGTSIKSNMEARASQKLTSNVLKKEHISFDSNTKDLVWKLTVNQNKTELGDITITDVLPEGLSCNEVRATLDDMPFEGENSFVVSNEADGTQKITVTLKAVTDTRVITFPTKVNVNAEIFRLKQSVSFKNVAEMVSDANGKTVKSNESEPKIKNNILTKNAEEKADGVSNKVRYTVEINPLGMELLKEGNSLKVVDSLPDGAYLDVDSVKLFAASTAVGFENGVYQTTMSQGAEIMPKPVVDYNTTDNMFKINLPVSKEDYILSYDVFIVRANVELTNKVKLEGSVLLDESDQQKTERQFTLRASGSARLRLPAGSFFSLELKKENESGEKLEGAVFGLYSAQKEESLLAKATCDKNSGIATLALPKKDIAGLTKLYWREIQAPAGYLIDSRWQEISIAGHNPDDVITVTNKKIPINPNAVLAIKKVDEEDTTKAIAGAEFALYTNKECTSLAGTQTTDQNGRCTFTGLMPYTIYYAKEMVAPNGYLLQEAPIEMISGNQGETAEYEVTNRAEDWDRRASVVVEKINKNGEMLAGAEFALYQADKATLIATKETDAGGLAVFYGLAEGSYFVKETRAPGGYILSDQWFEVSVRRNELSKISVLNTRKSGAPGIESENRPSKPGLEEPPKEENPNAENPNGEIFGEENPNGENFNVQIPKAEKPDEMETLEHDSVQTGSVDATTAANGKKGNAPQTGDKRQIVFWAGLMAVSLLVWGLLGRKKAKTEK